MGVSTDSRAGGPAAERDELARHLEEARARTLRLLDPISDADQRAQHSPLMSPMVWDLAHVANYEELWLLRAIDGRQPVDTQLDDMYNAFEHPRTERPSLPLLEPAEARRYAADTRAGVLSLLSETDLASQRLTRDGFVYRMVVQHEHQHDETLLATRQLMLDRCPALVDPAPAPQPGSVPGSGEVLVPAGPFEMGTSTDAWAYDNERPAHIIELDDFCIDASPVTNEDYERFIAGGGYDDPAVWTEKGWKWRQEEGLEHPLFWRATSHGWERLRFGTWAPLDPREPVQHVCWYEADAFARWSGKRLPTEAEWEKAATWDDAACRKRLYPWGDEPHRPALANLGGVLDGPSPVGSHPEGISLSGCHQLIGDVWEWTSSDFGPYPGFEAYPYAEYSEVFWGGEYKVLRGGSWATHPTATRGTFRNWDYPIRRQIFAGFRCARSPEA